MRSRTCDIARQGFLIGEEKSVCFPMGKENMAVVTDASEKRMLMGEEKR
jgi:hypothetical protein